MKTIIIIAGAATVAYIAYRFFLKNNSEPKLTIDSTNGESNSSTEKRNKIRQDVINLKEKYFKNLLNFEITFLVQTELDNSTLEEKIYSEYPKTLGSDLLLISKLYPTYGASLVEECIIEYLYELNIEYVDTENKQPSEILDHFIKQEAKQEARKIFEKYLG